MKLAWIVPGDGSVVSVARSCCHQASLVGHDVALLSIQRLQRSLPTQRDGYPTETLDCRPPFRDAPAKFISWLRRSQPNVVLLNSAAPLERAVLHIQPNIGCVLVVHGLLPYQVDPAVNFQASLEATVAVSHATARRIVERGADPSRLHVIYNGIRFEEASASKAIDRRDLVFLGGGSLNKGYKDVIGIWRELVATGYNGLLHWLGHLDRRQKEEVGSLPGADRVKLHGLQDRRRVFDLLGQSAVLLMPSRSESFGLAAVEALSMGSVPIVWDIPSNGIAEVVGPGYPFAIPEGDLHGAAKAVHQAIEKRAKIAPRFGDDVRSRFSEAQMWQGYEQVLDVVARSPARLRPKCGLAPQPYRPNFRLLKLVPRRVRAALGEAVVRYPLFYRYLRHRL